MKSSSQDTWLYQGMSMAFILLWSTGFIGAKYGLPYAEPMTFLTVRFILAALLLWFVAFVMRAPWPKTKRQVMHITVVGLLLHGVYLGSVFSAIAQGVQAGVVALIVSLQPILTAVIVRFGAGGFVSARQWMGLGLGLGGVLLVVIDKWALSGQAYGGVALTVTALLGITISTLYQKRYCADMDVRSGSVIQLLAACVVTAIMAWCFEERTIIWSNEFVFALVWLVMVLSLGAFLLLYSLIRLGETVRVVSLFYMVPPMTAIMAWWMFGETFSWFEWLGMALVVLGLILVNRRGNALAVSRS